jgi:NAD(P)-dependent dehydrogenase (short-subunit alcohol dehydrogenase family)
MVDLVKMHSLEGKVIIITGASGYFGQQIVFALLKAKARLVIIGRNKLNLESLKASLEPEFQSRCDVMALDITKTKSIAIIANSIKRNYGELHGLVNNAYSGRSGSFNKINRNDFLDACTINLITPFELIKSLAPLLKKTADRYNYSTSIVNVSSMYGMVSPYPDVYGESEKDNPIHYGSSKAGMIQMTKYFACYLANQGIRVNSISPGAFPNTEVQPTIPNFYEKLKSKIPMNRFGRPEEVSGPVLFLLSDASSYVTGINMPIDGGWTSW